MFVRTVLVTFRPGAEEKGVAVLQQQAQFQRGSPGCRRALVGTPVHGASYLLYSEWETGSDIDRLEARLRIDPDASSSFFGLMALASSPPVVAMYEVVS